MILCYKFVNYVVTLILFKKKPLDKKKYVVSPSITKPTPTHEKDYPTKSSNDTIGAYN